MAATGILERSVRGVMANRPNNLLWSCCVIYSFRAFSYTCIRSVSLSIV